MQRLRIAFAKTAAMRFTGHLDLHKTWERTLRRARLPLAYSEGFNPHPRLQLAAALPLGFTSACELADVWLDTPQDLTAARAALEQAAPPGIVVTDVQEVPLNAPTLQTQVVAAEYLVEVTASERLPAPRFLAGLRAKQSPGKEEDCFTALLAARSDIEFRGELETRITALLAAPEIRRVRREKEYDLRPLIEKLYLAPHPEAETSAVTIVARLAAREGATGRPEEVLEALGLPSAEAAFHRQKLILKPCLGE